MRRSIFSLLLLLPLCGAGHAVPAADSLPLHPPAPAIAPATIAFSPAGRTEELPQLAGDTRPAVQTHRIERPYGGKNIDVLCERFAQSIESGRRCEELPCFRDAAIASEYAWKFIHDARTHDLPAIGDLRTLQQIRERRRTMKNGYGLLRKRA